ncbi:hypothetical protein DR950_25575 [Kitasatospora xanthocidica]|uniref:PBP domain-containing protein n=1 Tax=Kitasatospora xanthocidica TaxID=83382 RepID=A0A372ZZ11_9ACTN|nr:substrate-binding domain-containing protein [Kitasatospora xanthocidica]RGD60692.1 hypothetical protein DR950_25575 [Kitasatospora xanthocidica]
MRKSMTKPGGVIAAAVMVAMTAGGTALADPVAGATPRAVDVVGVGDETTQILMNQVAASYNASLTDPAVPRLYSWDSRPSGTITTKSGGTPIARPFGVYGGMTTLNGYTSATVDFARSSRGAQQDDPPADGFVAYAKDVVTWAAPANGHAPANLSTQNLRDIYTCVVTTWNQIDPSLPNSTIKPYLPPIQSALTANFRSDINYGSPLGPGACVTWSMAPNQGSDPALSDPDALVPYSTGYFIGQAYQGQGGGSDVQGPLTPRSIDGIAPIDPQTKTISADALMTPYAAVLSNVVRDAEWTATDAHGVALRDIFSRNGWICRNGADAIKRSGFLPLPSIACGRYNHS